MMVELVKGFQSVGAWLCCLNPQDSDRRNIKHGVINRLSLPVQGPKSKTFPMTLPWDVGDAAFEVDLMRAFDQAVKWGHAAYNQPIQDSLGYVEA